MALKPLTRRITALFRTATAEQIDAGAQWYADAHELAVTMAYAHGVTVSQAAGVIAAVSPLNSWGNNINLANRLIAAGGLTSGYLKLGLGKAQRILDGEDPVTVLNGDKIVNFYRSIVTAGADGVTVDRHAFSLAVGVRFEDGSMPSIGHKRYADTADCYRRAARILSAEYGRTISAAQVQAVTWKLWRARFWAEGAWDAHEAI